MSYLVTVSVEIKNGTSGDYENVFAAFETLGLKRPSSGQSREAKLPTALVAGLFMGASGAEIKEVLGKACVGVFNDKALKGEIFLAVTRIDASGSKHSMAKTIEEPVKHLKAMSHALSENDRNDCQPNTPPGKNGGPFSKFPKKRILSRNHVSKAERAACVIRLIV